MIRPESGPEYASNYNSGKPGAPCTICGNRFGAEDFYKLQQRPKILVGPQKEFVLRKNAEAILGAGDHHGLGHICPLCTTKYGDELREYLIPMRRESRYDASCSFWQDDAEFTNFKDAEAWVIDHSKKCGRTVEEHGGIFVSTKWIEDFNTRWTPGEARPQANPATKKDVA